MAQARDENRVHPYSPVLFPATFTTTAHTCAVKASKMCSKNIINTIVGYYFVVHLPMFVLVEAKK